MEDIDNHTYHQTDESTENTRTINKSEDQQLFYDQSTESVDDQPIYASEVLIKKIKDNQRVLTPQQCDQLLNELVEKGCWHPMIALKFKKSIIKISEMMQSVDKKEKKMKEVVSDPDFYNNFYIVYEMMDMISVSCALEDKCDEMIKNAEDPTFNKEIKKKIESALFLIDMYFPMMLRYADFMDNAVQQSGKSYDIKRSIINDIAVFKTNLQTYIEKKMSKYSKRQHQPVQYADTDDANDWFEYMIILAIFLTIIYIVFSKKYK